MSRASWSARPSRRPRRTALTACACRHRRRRNSLPILWSASADKLTRPGKKRAWLSLIIIAVRHWFAATAATESSSETDADADTDAFHNGARRRTGRTTLDHDFLGRRPALRLRSINPLDARYIDSLGRRYVDLLDRRCIDPLDRRIDIFLQRQRGLNGAWAGRPQRNIGRLQDRRNERGVGAERAVEDALAHLARGRCQIAVAIACKELIEGGRRIDGNGGIPCQHLAPAFQQRTHTWGIRGLREQHRKGFVGCDRVIGDHELVGNFRLLALQVLAPVVD